MGWYPRLTRGSTFRVPITLTDASGVPILITSSEFAITPDLGAQITLNQANGKLILTSFIWKGAWSALTAYLSGEAVSYNVPDKSDLWIALQSGTNKVPGAIGSETYWKPLAQFEFLLSAIEVSSYTWFRGTYSWSRTYSNGDVKIRTGLIEVQG